MSKLEKVVNTVYITGGLVLILVVIMSVSSCGSSKCGYKVGTGEQLRSTCGGTGYLND